MCIKIYFWQLSTNWFKPVQMWFLVSNFWLINFTVVIPIGREFPAQNLLNQI